MFNCSMIRSRSREARRRGRSDFVEVIDNPILNSPFTEPARHFRFSDEGITSEIVESRRVSSYFIPIPKPKKKGSQLAFDTEWTQDRVEENVFINRVRFHVQHWR